MRGAGKFFALAFAIMVLIGLSKMCSGEWAKEEKLEDKNTQIELIVQGPTYNDDFNNGKINNYIAVGFKNIGSEDVIEVTCTVHLFDANNVEIGTLNYDYNVYDGIGKGITVKQNETTALYSMYHTNYDGKIATSYTVTDLKVNGRDR